MGNMGSSGEHGRRSNSGGQSHPPPPSQPENTANRYVFAAATPYANRNTGHQYPSYYPHPGALPIPMAAVGDHHAPPLPNRVNGGYHGGPLMQPPVCVEHQEAVSIRNDVNVKKETLRIQPDEGNPGKYLLEFTFDATVPGSITIIFFAKEGEDCNLIPTNESLYPPITLNFREGLAQKFKQSSGTGIDLSSFEEEELSKNDEVFPLAVRAESSPPKPGDTDIGPTNSQTTQAIFEKEKGEYQVKVVKQILWVNGTRYELQEIYGIGNSVEEEFEGNDSGKECVICLTEPQDTTVLPCRHMCMCSECAKVLRFQTNRCPICRQPVERLLEIKISNGTEE